MDKFLRYAVYIAAAAQLVFVVMMLPELNSGDLLAALLLLVLPVLSIIALYTGPGLEERRLERQVSKARLEKELAQLKKD